MASNCHSLEPYMKLCIQLITIVHHDAIIFKEEIDICFESCLSSFPHHCQDIASMFNVLLYGIKLQMEII